MKVEPFVHLTLSEAKNVVVNPVDYNKKLYFQEWYNQLQPNDILLKKSSELIAMLAEYSKNKGVYEPKETIIN